MTPEEKERVIELENELDDLEWRLEALDDGWENSDEEADLQDEIEGVLYEIDLIKYGTPKYYILSTDKPPRLLHGPLTKKPYDSPTPESQVVTVWTKP